MTENIANMIPNNTGRNICINRNGCATISKSMNIKMELQACVSTLVAFKELSAAGFGQMKQIKYIEYLSLVKPLVG